MHYSKELIRHDGLQITYKVVQSHPFQPAERRAFIEHAYEAHASSRAHLESIHIKHRTLNRRTHLEDDFGAESRPPEWDGTQLSKRAH